MLGGVSRKGSVALAAMLCATAVLGVVGCSAPSVGAGNGSDAASATEGDAQEISVYAREDGSGTRGAFVELFGLEEKAPDGSTVDATTDDAAITNSTSVMMTSVASDPAGIGYVSLSSLNDTVKAVSIDGVEATAANVKDGSYSVSRPFNIVVTDSAPEAARDFIDFILSADGQAVIEDNHCIAVADGAAPYRASGVAGKVVVAGSSSVAPVMEKLAEAYETANPAATVEVQQSDSTTGVTMAVDGTADIGMASRELKDSERSAGGESIEIARDGIAVIVHPGSAVDGFTSDQVKAIFSGEALTWADAVA